jgi:cyclopropane fatty-acyl-phospholipid synthase-like methyltransferase
MRRDWDRRALENARHFVATGQTEWSDAEFFQAGEQEVRDHILNDLENICQGRDPKNMRVLEIGCGAGRVTRALAQFFGEVYAVDISPEMVSQARQAVADFPNAHISCNNGRDLTVLQQPWWQRLVGAGKLEFDFAFSCMVFQHVPSRKVIASYLRSVHNILRPGTLFKFQLQGYTEKAPNLDDSWSGYAFGREDARKLAEENGFELRYEWGAGSQYYWLWCFRK